MVFGLFRSKRQRQYLKIEKILSRMIGELPPDHGKFFQAIDEAEEELWRLLEADEYLTDILSEFRVTASLLKDIYRELIEIGAGQNRGGRYVPVATLTELRTLAYCLSVLTTENPNQEEKLEMGYNLMMYFEGSHRDMLFSKTKFPSG